MSAWRRLGIADLFVLRDRAGELGTAASRLMADDCPYDCTIHPFMMGTLTVKCPGPPNSPFAAHGSAMPWDASAKPAVSARGRRSRTPADLPGM
ncbi:hypothetical protein NKH18_35475 [Streptomyces sp. M10(2022)]